MPCYPFPGLFLIRLKFQIACFYLFVYLFTYVQFDRFNSIIIRNCFNQNQLRWTRNISFFFQVVSSNYSLENNSYRCTYTFDSSTPLETRERFQNSNSRLLFAPNTLQEKPVVKPEKQRQKLEFNFCQFMLERSSCSISLSVPYPRIFVLEITQMAPSGLEYETAIATALVIHAVVRFHFSWNPRASALPRKFDATFRRRVPRMIRIFGRVDVEIGCKITRDTLLR